MGICTFASVLLASVLAGAVGIVAPAWTNHNNISGSQPMMTNFVAWATGVQAVAEHALPDDEAALRGSVAFSNAVSAVGVSNAYTKAEMDARLAEKIGGGDVPSFEQDPTVPAWAKTDNPPVTPSSTNPGYAKNADYARSAGTASKATKADEADYAAFADEANWASTAAEADFASEAQNAQSANTAIQANTAAKATLAQTANHAADADKAHSLHDETTAENDISITPTFTVSDRYWIVKDTNHPDGFRLQPTDLSDYYTKAQADTNAAAIANYAISTNSLTTNLTARLAEKRGMADLSFEHLSPKEAVTQVVFTVSSGLSLLSGDYAYSAREGAWLVDTGSSVRIVRLPSGEFWLTDDMEEVQSDHFSDVPFSGDLIHPSLGAVKFTVRRKTNATLALTEQIAVATNGIPEAIALKADKADTFTKYESSTNATAKANAAIATNEATTNLTERMAGKLDKITGNPSTYLGNSMALNTRVDGLEGTIYQTDYDEPYPLSTFNLEYCSINSSFRSNGKTAGIVTYGDGGDGFGIAQSKSNFDNRIYSMFYGDGWIGDSFGRYIEIPRDADGTLALVSQIEDATNGVHVAITNLAEKVDSKLAGYVPWANAAHNAVTIGSRESGSRIGDNSLAQGANLKATGNYTHAEGYYTNAEGDSTHAEGNSTHADGNYTHAEGFYTHAEGFYTHAEGGATHAEGNYTHAEGFYTHAEGVATHAEGGYTTAGKSSGNRGQYAHAAGFNAYATNVTAFTWNGSVKDSPSTYNTSADYVPPYGDHGNGTYNLNPVGGLSGFWIGETNMATHIANLAPQTDLSDYFTKAESSTNATAKANAAIEAATNGLAKAFSSGLSYLKGDATVLDAVRAHNGLLANIRGETLPDGFTVDGWAVGFDTLREAVDCVASSINGDAVIRAKSDFTVDGTENWASLGARRLTIAGLAPGRGVVMTHVGRPENGIFAGASRLSGVLTNLTVSSAPATKIANVELVDVTWEGSLTGASPFGSDYRRIRMTDVDVDALGGKYALDVVQGSSDGDAFTRCTFQNFSRSAVGFVYHSGNVVFEDCVFDGSSVDRPDTVGLVNFQGGDGPSLGDPVFRRCEFRGLKRTVAGKTVNGPAVADRVPDGKTAGTMTFDRCTFADTVAYVIAFGDAYGGASSTHIHFNVTGDGNYWTDWNAETGRGTKMRPFGSRFTGFGYLGDAPSVGSVDERPWEGDGATGSYGSIGRRIALSVQALAAPPSAPTTASIPGHPGVPVLPRYAPLSSVRLTQPLLLNADELVAGRLADDYASMTNSAAFRAAVRTAAASMIRDAMNGLAGTVTAADLLNALKHIGE